MTDSKKVIMRRGRDRNQINHGVTDKIKLRDDIERQTQEFLNKGGVIQKMGVTIAKNAKGETTKSARFSNPKRKDPVDDTTS